MYGKLSDLPEAQASGDPQTKLFLSSKREGTLPLPYKIHFHVTKLAPDSNHNKTFIFQTEC